MNSKFGKILVSSILLGSTISVSTAPVFAEQQDGKYANLVVPSPMLDSEVAPAPEFNLNELAKDLEKELNSLSDGEAVVTTLDNSKLSILINEENELTTTIIADLKTNEIFYNGEKMEITSTVTIEPELLVENSFARAAYDPVYQATYTHDLSKIPGDLGKIAVYSALFITAITPIASGASITASALLSQGKKALTAMGLSYATTILGDIVNGKWSYKLYKTKEKVPTGYPGTPNQYAYRYQDTNVSFYLKVGKLQSPKLTTKGKTGRWWFSSKPFNEEL